MAFFDIKAYDYDEARDGDRCWLSGALWAFPPWTPIMRQWLDITGFGIWKAYEYWSIPGTRGWDQRVHNGVFYISAMEIKDENIRKEREKKFLEHANAKGLLDDAIKYWDSFKPELDRISRPLLNFDLQRSNDAELSNHIYECANALRLMGVIHYQVMAGIGGLTFYFRDLLKKHLNMSMQDPEFSTLISGFETKLYEANKEIINLAERADKLGLKHVFLSQNSDTILSELAKTENGNKWISDFHNFMEIYGIRPRVQGVFLPTWVEMPSIPLGEVKKAISGPYAAPDQNREALIKKREETEKELLNKIPVNDREFFRKMMRGAQAWTVFNEDHPYYTEFPFFACLRLASIEAGTRLNQRGILENPEDAILLYPVEIQVALHGYESAVKDIVARRKEECERYIKAEHPPFLGNPERFEEMVSVDPILSIGIAKPIGKPEDLGAIVVGSAGAPGVAEGNARVILSVNQLEDILPGEILVTVSTSPQWVTVFGVIKGVVTDLGGPLAHALVVSREYGMPCVVGTLDATKKIKNGQRIKIDGNGYVVYALE